MNEAAPDQLQRAVESQHGGTATLAQSVPVKETHAGAAASRAYAWSSPIEGSDKRRFFAVLHQGPVKSPVDAVRAAIVAEQRAER